MIKFLSDHVWNNTKITVEIDKLIQNEKETAEFPAKNAILEVKVYLTIREKKIKIATFTGDAETIENNIKNELEDNLTSILTVEKELPEEYQNKKKPAAGKEPDTGELNIKVGQKTIQDSDNVDWTKNM